MKKIEAPQAPRAVGPYSQAIQEGGLLFVSGQIGLNPSSGKIEETTTEGQTRQVCRNIQAILNAAGLSFAQVVRCEVFMTDLAQFPVMNQVYAEFFSHSLQPARQTIQVARLPMDALIEISCIATAHP